MIYGKLPHISEVNNILLSNSKSMKKSEWKGEGLSTEINYNINYNTT